MKQKFIEVTARPEKGETLATFVDANEIIAIDELPRGGCTIYFGAHSLRAEESAKEIMGRIHAVA